LCYNLKSAIVAGHQNLMNDSDSDSEVKMEEVDKVYLFVIYVNKYILA